MEHEFGISYYGYSSFPGLGVEDGHDPPFWLLLQVSQQVFMTLIAGTRAVARFCPGASRREVADTTAKTSGEEEVLV